MELFRNRDLTNLLLSDNADEEGFLSHFGIRRRRQPKDPNRFPKVPSEEGLKLMRAGAFGANDYDLHTRKHLARRMLERELGVGDREERRRNSDLVTQVRISPSERNATSTCVQSLTCAITGNDTGNKSRANYPL